MRNLVAERNGIGERADRAPNTTSEISQIVRARVALLTSCYGGAFTYKRNYRRRLNVLIERLYVKNYDAQRT